MGQETSVGLCTGVDLTNIFCAAFTRSGVNFIIVLRTAFTLIDPKSVKKIDKLTAFFTLLGSAHVKAVSRMLVKLTPDLKRAKNIFCAFGICAHKSFV
jgi:hypothetical protein